MNHSQFVEDTFFMRGAPCIVARIFKVILDQFMEASGGLLNNAKSSIFGWNTPIITLQHVSQFFGIPFKSNWSHFKHLGLPISKDVMKVEVWYVIVDKMKKKMKN